MGLFEKRKMGMIEIRHSFSKRLFPILVQMKVNHYQHTKDFLQDFANLSLKFDAVTV